MGPTVKIEPGTATGVNGDGTPKDKPPSPDVNPAAPAVIPPSGPVPTLDSAVITSAEIDPATFKSPLKYKLSPVFKRKDPPVIGSACRIISWSETISIPLDP